MWTTLQTGADIGMTRTEFEQLRDLPEKLIRGTVEFKRKQPRRSFFFSGQIAIENRLDVKLILEINYQPQARAKTFTVRAPEAGGNICRLCIDGQEHEPFGECHRHCMANEECQRIGKLHKDIVSLPHLADADLATSFRYFCNTANIRFLGNFRGADNTEWVTDV